MYYFYCPKCGFQKETKEVPQCAVKNTRGGGGRTPIYHFRCDKCNNPHAGFMFMENINTDKKVYYRSVIGLYQGVESNLLHKYGEQNGETNDKEHLI